MKSMSLLVCALLASCGLSTGVSPGPSAADIAAARRANREAFAGWYVQFQQAAASPAPDDHKQWAAKAVPMIAWDDLWADPLVAATVVDRGSLITQARELAVRAANELPGDVAPIDTLANIDQLRAMIAEKQLAAERAERQRVEEELAAQQAAYEQQQLQEQKQQVQQQQYGAQPQGECLAEYGTRACGYHCLAEYGVVKCASTPQGACAAEYGQVICWDPPYTPAWGAPAGQCLAEYGTIVCGYHCVAEYGTVKCASTPQGACTADAGTVTCWDP